MGKNQRAVVYGVPGKKVIDDVPKTPESEEAKDAAAASSSGTTGQQDWRAQQPKAGPTSQLALPTPKRFKLSNGLTVMLVERHNLPIVSANLVVLSGSETNPVNKPGLASFTADMLDEGTNKRSTLQIADDVAQIGAILGGGSSQRLFHRHHPHAEEERGRGF